MENHQFITNNPTHHPQHQPILDNIIVGYAFGPKKMETMGLIMAEASKALSTVNIAPTVSIARESFSSSSSTQNTNNNIKQTMESLYYFPDDVDDEDAKSLGSTSMKCTSSIASSYKSLQRPNNTNGLQEGIQLTFLPESLHSWVGSIGDNDKLFLPSSSDSLGTGVVTSSDVKGPSIKKLECWERSCNSHSMVQQQQHTTTSPISSQSSSKKLHMEGTTTTTMKRHPIRVSFVPIDLDTPLQEQHGGKFDVILHKMTEDILCISKMLSRHPRNARGEEGETDQIDEAMRLLLHDNSNTTTSTAHSKDMPYSRHEERAVERIKRLREYKEVCHPSCVLVDSPVNILAVMSRADMAEVLSSCLEGVTTTSRGVPVSTPRFRVVEDAREESVSILAKEMDADGFRYPLIAKPLTAAGTKSSHHMGIVMARDGLLRLKTPCILQEFANHGGELFKVYVLGESVWVFSRESLPNLPVGESELPSRHEDRSRTQRKSYVEFQRPAGSRCYVEFNSQRPYPTLSDFGIDDGDTASSMEVKMNAQENGPMNKKPRIHSPISKDEIDISDLASYVTKEEIEPVTNTLRAAFGLELFGFDVLVKHNKSQGDSNTSNLDVKEILVVDVNYFPGYKEVPHFPSLLAQYLTQKAVETRINVSS